MSCLAVRDRFPELAIGVLQARERAQIDRHIAWCAACRKEVSELEEAASLLPFALEPAGPPAGLEETVVAAVRDAARRGRPSARRGRLAGAAVVAAVVAVAALGWGAAMAGRADRFRDEAIESRRDQVAAIRAFSDVLRELPELGVPGTRVGLGTLASPTGRPGGGVVLTFSSPDLLDFAMVRVNGLRAGAVALPLSVTLVGDHGELLPVGAIEELDADGGAELFAEYGRDLTSYGTVVVRDASGAVVMRGSVRETAAGVSPSP